MIVLVQRFNEFSYFTVCHSVLGAFKIILSIISFNLLKGNEIDIIIIIPNFEEIDKLMCKD